MNDPAPTSSILGKDEFSGKVAVVTGAAQGIGKAIVRLFASRGASVAILDIDAENAWAVARSCESEYRVEAQAQACDMRSSRAVGASFAAVQQRFGRIDVLVNAAGIFPRAAAAHVTDELLVEVMSVNFYGVVYATRAALPLMSAQPGASIVNIASGAAVRPVRGLSIYGASKAAMIAYSRTLALELAPSIRVNVVSPGPTDTLAARATLSDEAFAEKIREISAQTPLGRLADLGEVAESVAFLASDRACFLTGQNLHVSGGRFMP